MILLSDGAGFLLDMLSAYKAPEVEKWIDPSST